MESENTTAPFVPPGWAGLVADYFESKSSDNVKSLKALQTILHQKNVDHLIEPLCTPKHIQKLMQSFGSNIKTEKEEAFEVLQILTSITNDYILDLVVSCDLLSAACTFIRFNVAGFRVSSCIILTNFLYRHTSKYKHVILPMVPHLKHMLKDELPLVRNEAFFALYACARHFDSPQREELLKEVLAIGRSLLSKEDYMNFFQHLVTFSKSHRSVRRFLDSDSAAQPLASSLPKTASMTDG